VSKRAKGQRAAPREGSAPGRKRLLLRLSVTFLFIASVSLIAVAIVKRPSTVKFDAKFRCTGLWPGGPIGVNLDWCDEVKFVAREIKPSGLLAQPAGGRSKMPDRYLSGDPVAVYGSGDVSAKLIGENFQGVAVKLPSDGGIELPMAKQPNPFGAIRLTGTNIGLMLFAYSIDAETDFAPDYSGFVLGDSSEPANWVESIGLDGYGDTQGGVPNTVHLEAKPASGPIIVTGTENKVSGGWTAIDWRAATHEEIPIRNCTMRADGLSSCEFTINGERVDLGTVNRLEVGIVAADLTGIKAYQDSSVAYVEVSIDGVARSIRLDNSERIQSTLTKVLSRPWYETGLVGIAVAFVLFVGGVVATRAVEALAEALLPKKG
jgi:hypothetical protein